MTCWDFFLKKEMIVFSDPLEDTSKVNYEIINSLIFSQLEQ